MIEVMQGSLGSGKSAVATARAIAHLQDGGVVAANFALTDGWADVVAKRNPLCYFSDNLRYEKAKSLWPRFHHVKSLAAIKELRPREQAEGRHKNSGQFQEGQGLLILDECQLIFNSRKWEKNMDWIEFFTQSRKLGWNILLIAHTIEMIDSQIRPLCEFESRFRNLQKVKFPMTPIPLSPFPLFVVVQRYAGLGAGASSVSSRALYPLPLWAARLYDSLAVFSADAWGSSPLPELCGNPPRPPSGLGVASPRLRKSTLSPDCLWSRSDKYFSDLSCDSMQ